MTSILNIFLNRLRCVVQAWSEDSQHVGWTMRQLQLSVDWAARERQVKRSRWSETSRRFYRRQIGRLRRARDSDVRWGSTVSRFHSQRLTINIAWSPADPRMPINSSASRTERHISEPRVLCWIQDISVFHSELRALVGLLQMACNLH